MKLIRGVLGVIVSLPGAYVAFFVIAFLYMLAINFFIEGPVVVTFFLRHSVFLVQLLWISLLSAVGFILASIVHLLLVTRYKDDDKALWILLLVIANVVALPLYWYLNIWRQTSFSQNRDAAQQLVGPERR